MSNDDQNYTVRKYNGDIDKHNKTIRNRNVRCKKRKHRSKSPKTSGCNQSSRLVQSKSGQLIPHNYNINNYRKTSVTGNSSKQTTSGNSECSFYKEEVIQRPKIRTRRINVEKGQNCTWYTNRDKSLVTENPFTRKLDNNKVKGEFKTHRKYEEGNKNENHRIRDEVQTKESKTNSYVSNKFSTTDTYSSSKEKGFWKLAAKELNSIPLSISSVFSSSVDVKNKEIYTREEQKSFKNKLFDLINRTINGSDGSTSSRIHSESFGSLPKKCNRSHKLETSDNERLKNVFLKFWENHCSSVEDNCITTNNENKIRSFTRNFDNSSDTATTRTRESEDHLKRTWRIAAEELCKPEETEKVKEKYEITDEERQKLEKHCASSQEDRDLLKKSYQERKKETDILQKDLDNYAKKEERANISIKEHENTVIRKTDKTKQGVNLFKPGLYVSFPSSDSVLVGSSISSLRTTSKISSYSGQSNRIPCITKGTALAKSAVFLNERRYLHREHKRKRFKTTDYKEIGTKHLSKSDTNVQPIQDDAVKKRMSALLRLHFEKLAQNKNIGEFPTKNNLVPYKNYDNYTEKRCVRYLANNFKSSESIIPMKDLDFILSGDYVVSNKQFKNSAVYQTYPVHKAPLFKPVKNRDNGFLFYQPKKKPKKEKFSKKEPEKLQVQVLQAPKKISDITLSEKSLTDEDTIKIISSKGTKTTSSYNFLSKINLYSPDQPQRKLSCYRSCCLGLNLPDVERKIKQDKKKQKESNDQSDESQGTTDEYSEEYCSDHAIKKKKSKWDLRGKSRKEEVVNIVQADYSNDTVKKGYFRPTRGIPSEYELKSSSFCCPGPGEDCTLKNYLKQMFCITIPTKQSEHSLKEDDPFISLKFDPNK